MERRWGMLVPRPGGYVYQKAYLEFFCYGDKLDSLVAKSRALSSLIFIAVNKEGKCATNTGSSDVNVVTWGVFPSKEMIQPTVVDSASFMVWKDEAFEIWTEGWACLFPGEDASRKLLEEIQRSYFLVSLDDDYTYGDIICCI